MVSKRTNRKPHTHRRKIRKLSVHINHSKTKKTIYVCSSSGRKVKSRRRRN